MSIKSTQILTRKEAEEKMVNIKLKEYEKMLKNHFDNVCNRQIEEYLEEMDEANDNPFTNYLIKDGK